MTPLLHISLPHHMANNNNASSSNSTWQRPADAASSGQPSSLVSRFRRYMEQRSSNNNSADSSSKSAISDTVRKPSSILHYRSPATAGGLLARSGLVSDQSQVIREEENESDYDTGDSEHIPGAGHEQKTAEGVDGTGDVSADLKRGEFRRAVSEGGARHSPSPQPDVVTQQTATVGWS